MTDKLYVILIKDYMVMDVHAFNRDEVQKAEEIFVQHLSEQIPDFQDYTAADINACLEGGYEGDANGNSIQLFWEQA